MKYTGQHGHLRSVQVEGDCLVLITSIHNRLFSKDGIPNGYDLASVYPPPLLPIQDAFQQEQQEEEAYNKAFLFHPSIILKAYVIFIDQKRNKPARCRDFLCGK
ncbi:hypothetical protein MRB53_001119 [Persea americana]|uniref:Uncharacterized protein n=1 Tax=Persea americana TaxID=3435 RepID=A0ACC2MRT1_PERAE|nr:hypothetical protein MRB53_001119 [Persea americana]